MANEFIARNGLISQNNSVVTGSLTVTQGITGSLQGTATTASYVQNAQSASYVLQAVSSSFASTASLAPNYVLISTTSSMSVATASYVQNAESASYVLQAVSSSFATTASFALSAGGGGVSKGLVQAMTVGLQNIF